MSCAIKQGIANQYNPLFFVSVLFFNIHLVQCLECPIVIREVLISVGKA